MVPNGILLSQTLVESVNTMYTYFCHSLLLSLNKKNKDDPNPRIKENQPIEISEKHVMTFLW